MLHSVQMARVKMTARRTDEGDVGTSAQGTSTPVTRSASKKKTPAKEKIPSKSAMRSRDGISESVEHAPSFDRPMVDSHLLFGTSTITRRDFEKYKDRGYLDDPKRCRPGGSDTSPAPKSDEIVLFEASYCRDFVSP